MRTSLANQLLRTLVNLGEEEEPELVRNLMTMAELKWDSYEGFRAGQRFMESLARWLQGFPDQPTRRRWLDFVLDQLVFVSAAEVDHLIAVTYPDFIRPAVLERAAAASGISRHRKAQLMNAPAFKVEQRRILVLALSDGARLDVLRRNSDLSHEQFVPQPAVPDDRRDDLHKKLEQALMKHGGKSHDPTFNHVLLVDDFYGSGTSLIDLLEGGDDSPKPTGKIAKFLKNADSLTTVASNDSPAIIARDYTGTILLYMASQRAKQHIEDCLVRADLADRWALEVVQMFDDTCRVTNTELLEDCDAFGTRAGRRTQEILCARLPRRRALGGPLSQRAEQQRQSVVGRDSTGRSRQSPDSLERRALFPRYERHHSGSALMAYPNPFRTRHSEAASAKPRHVHRDVCTRSAPRPPAPPFDQFYVLRSAPGAGKTSLMKCLTASTLSYIHQHRSKSTNLVSFLTDFGVQIRPVRS